MRSLVVGLGNERRGDDAAGLVVARRLRGAIGGDTTVLEHPGEPVDLIADWDGFDLVVLIDAARGRGAGAIRRYEYGVHALPAGTLGASSHAFDLAVAIELASTVGRMPRRLVVYAVSGERFGFGEPLSPAVRTAVDEVVGLVRREVRGAECDTQVSWSREHQRT